MTREEALDALYQIKHVTGITFPNFEKNYCDIVASFESLNKEAFVNNAIIMYHYIAKHKHFNWND